MALWMKTLSDHYNQMRERYPDDRLMILFDIDGTIFDTRYIVYDALKTFDGQHGTALKAVLLLPCSITSDFNFPKWHYHGRGYGPQRSFDEYTVGCLSGSFFWGAKTNKENICSGHQRSSS